MHEYHNAYYARYLNWQVSKITSFIDVVSSFLLKIQFGGVFKTVINQLDLDI